MMMDEEQAAATTAADNNPNNKPEGTEDDNDTDEDTDVDLETAAEPHASSGKRLEVVSTAAPQDLCGHEWYPTQAVLKEGTTEYQWNARAHRKLRYPTATKDSQDYHPEKLHQRLRLVCWQPQVVTFYMVWIGNVANTLWVVNGIYAVWPELALKADPEIISWATGVVGAFLFMVGGYLGFVEAINQTYSPVQLPPNTKEEDHDDGAATSSSNKKKKKRRYVRPPHIYGQRYGPLRRHGILQDKAKQSEAAEILTEGYPLVQDVQSKQLVTASLFETYLHDVLGNSKTRAEKALKGRKLDIRVGGQVLGVTVDSWEIVQENNSTNNKKDKSSVGIASLQEPAAPSYYKWWTWKPDMKHIGIFNAVVYFMAVIVFFIPACASWPMENKGRASLGSIIFWVYVLQILPSLAFIYVGFAAMAEVSASWFKPTLDDIGWWISLFNTIGGVGFLLYPILALPSVVGDENCCNALYQWGAAMATLWGSCYFWMSGILQTIEFSSQHPILLGKKKKKD